VDKGEEALDAARRELYEETGVRSAEYLGEARTLLSCYSRWLCFLL
jgi:8-oxo-dGTP pyrophosphatase MutT (NUDIX family)